MEKWTSLKGKVWLVMETKLFGSEAHEVCDNVVLTAHLFRERPFKGGVTLVLSGLALVLGSKMENNGKLGAQDVCLHVCSWVRELRAECMWFPVTHPLGSE